MAAKVEKDAVSGTDTTGHVWDGIRELNTPLPKWWLYVFYACIIWSIGYWVVYPAWPSLSNYTKGVFGYNSHAEFAARMAEVEQSRKQWTDRIAAMSVDQVAADTELLQYAMAGGRAVFGENCAPCHGSGGQGAKGFPVLADDDWLWGGSLDNIRQTVLYGIRSGNDEARVSEMPKFGTDEILEPAQIDDVAQFVMSLSNRATDAAAAQRGSELFAENCAVCHGDTGQGMQELGAPNLTDDIWLYGGSQEAITAQIADPKQGVMPAWDGRLSETAVKMATVYVHSLGGGQ
ncbi:MAG: cytochrome-c oxidase, cbb3-type subunit III [Geminicoccaceae bacterium]